MLKFFLLSKRIFEGFELVLFKSSNVSGDIIGDFTPHLPHSRQKCICHQSNVPPLKQGAPNYGCKIKEPCVKAANLSSKQPINNKTTPMNVRRSGWGLMGGTKNVHSLVISLMEGFSYLANVLSWLDSPGVVLHLARKSICMHQT